MDNGWSDKCSILGAGESRTTSETAQWPEQIAESGPLTEAEAANFKSGTADRLCSTVLTAAGGLNADGLSLDASDATIFTLTVVGNNLVLSVPEPRCLILAILGFFAQHGVLVRSWRRKSQHYA